jgi:general stress protein YciG
MAERDDDTNSNRGFASMDKETRERIARNGGEESHKNDDKRSSGSAGGHGGSSGVNSSSGRSSRD